MQFTKSMKIILGKAFIFSSIFGLASITGIAFNKINNITNDNNLNTKISLVNNAGSENTDILNSYLTHFENVSMIANNPSIEISMSGSLWDGNKFQAWLNKSSMDQARNKSNLWKKWNNYEYFNIAINTSSNYDIQSLQQYVNLYANGKYVWENGFTSKFNLMRTIISNTITNNDFDVTKPFYLNLTQNSSSELINTYRPKQEGSAMTWELSSSMIGLPGSDTVTFNNNLSSSLNQNEFTIQRSDNIANGQSRTEIFSSTPGVPFTLKISPESTIVNFLNMGECKLVDFLTWIRNTLPNSNQNLISFGTQISSDDAIVINQNEILNYLPSELVNINQTKFYANSINTQLVRHAVTTNLWQISAVHNLNDNSLKSEVLNSVKTVLAKNNIQKNFDDSMGIIYKVIRLENASDFIQDERKVNNKVPWLWYVCDTPDNANASYYIVKFETIKKLYLVSDIKYKDETGFYLNTSGDKFTNLNQQKINWPSQIDLSYDANQWFDIYNNSINPNNPNASSNFLINLNFVSKQNVPFKLNFTSENNNLINTDLYNGLLKIFNSKGINLSELGYSISCGNINDTSMTIDFNKPVIINNQLNKKEIDSTYIIVIVALSGFILVLIIFMSIYISRNKKKKTVIKSFSPINNNNKVVGYLPGKAPQINSFKVSKTNINNFVKPTSNISRNLNVIKKKTRL